MSMIKTICVMVGFGFFMYGMMFRDWFKLIGGFALFFTGLLMQDKP